MTGSGIQMTAVKEIAMGVAQCALILGLLMIFPLAGVFAAVFLPLPVLFYRLKLGRNNGGIIVVITLGLLLIATGAPGMDLIFPAALLISGLFLGECIERNMNITQIMFFTFAGVIGAVFLALTVLGAFQGQSPAQMISSYTAGYPAVFTQLYQEMGISQEQVTGLVSLVMSVLPGMLMTSFLSIMLLNILIIKKLLVRHGIVLHSLSNLGCYQVPNFLVWVVIGISASLILTVSDSGTMGGLRYISINILILLMLIYFFQGIAIVAFFFEKKNVPVPVRIFCYALIALQFYFSILVVGLGFFDHWANFRKIHTDSR